jgi:hypothetical protein
MGFIDYASYQLNRKFTRSLMASILATIGLLGGVIPQFSWQSSSLSFSYLAYTQDFSDEQITKYAKAVLQIESYRLQAYQSIQKIIGQSPPIIVCNQRNTLRNLPADAQKIAVDYCNRSKKVVENSGLSVAQFNAMTTRVQSDQTLEKRIQTAIVRIRQQR